MRTTIRATSTGTNKRRWLQFRLRTLFVLTAMLAVCMAWYFSRTERQRRSVAAIRALGGRVVYGSVVGLPELVPGWVQRLLGDDYFFTVTQVDLSSNTRVSNETLVHLKELENLRTLDLEQTQVTGPGLRHLKGLSKLERLRLDGIPITDKALDELAGLRNLRFLTLDGAHLTDKGLALLNGMTNLRLLALRGASLSDAGMEQLNGLRSLEYLYVSGSGITDAGVMNLKGLRNLSVVGLTGTQVTRPGAKRLIDEAPNLYAVDLDSQRITR